MGVSRKGPPRFQLIFPIYLQKVPRGRNEFSPTYLYRGYKVSFMQPGWFQYIISVSIRHSTWCLDNRLCTQGLTYHDLIDASSQPLDIALQHQWFAKFQDPQTWRENPQLL